MDRVLGISISGIAVAAQRIRSGAQATVAATSTGGTMPGVPLQGPSAPRTRPPVVLRSAMTGPASTTGAARAAAAPAAVAVPIVVPNPAAGTTPAGETSAARVPPTTQTPSAAMAATSGTAAAGTTTMQFVPTNLLLAQLPTSTSAQISYRSNIAALRRAVAAYNAIMAIFIG